MELKDPIKKWTLNNFALYGNYLITGKRIKIRRGKRTGFCIKLKAEDLSTQYVNYQVMKIIILKHLI